MLHPISQLLYNLRGLVSVLINVMFNSGGNDLITWKKDMCTWIG